MKKLKALRNQLKAFWNTHKQDISIIVAIVGTLSKVAGIGLDIYKEFKPPQCDIPTMSEVREVEVEDQNQNYFN